MMVSAFPGRPVPRPAARRPPQVLLRSVAVVGVLTLCWSTSFRDRHEESAGDGTAFSHPQVTPRPESRTSYGLRASGQASEKGSRRLLILGGNGYVGREVCKLSVERGWQVTSLSRRGENPEPGNPQLDQVRWVKGNAADADTLRQLVGEADAAVHVSGSKSVADETSTYDTVTRKTAFNLINALKQKFRMPFSAPTPVMFVSAAEAGWPDVNFGPQVEEAAPGWLKEYLMAKRAVERELTSSRESIRPVMFRPSLIWSWTKFDVLPVIPVFNALNALGVPFVDKTVTVSTLSKAIMAGLEDDGLSGVQRFEQMEQLETRI
mmetsp:Transcript_72862/g.131253  ORF Transcript_72862/g.131253 Transcript_72862/m.131253 type:complete len:321 (+) Transcript_72862:59-1021(+)